MLKGHIDNASCHMVSICASVRPGAAAIIVSVG
jgi:hypothetical protein